ncbi:MAG: hypothetical protein U0Y68_06995 [Blastocatellia bacterium]
MTRDWKLCFEIRAGIVLPWRDRDDQRSAQLRVTLCGDWDLRLASRTKTEGQDEQKE